MKKIIRMMIVPALAFTMASCGSNNPTKTSVVEHTHELVYVEANDATCEQEGNVAYYKCDGCGKYFLNENGSQETTLEEVTIPVTDHTYSSQWSFDDNYHWHAATCSHQDEVADKAAHSGGTATCQSKAICEVCGVEYGELGDHVFDQRVESEYYFKSQGDCTHGDEYYYSCACGERGTETFRNETYHHEWDDGVITTPPTYSSDGVITYTCLHCDETKTEAVSASEATVFGGAGTEESPYKISCLSALEYLAKRVADGILYANNYFVVTNNISGVNFTIGADANNYFKGNFDGNNKTIEVNILGGKYAGLFGKLEVPSVVKNVVVTGVVDSTGQYVGGLVGASNGAVLMNCTNRANVTSTSGDVGGISGFSRGQLTNCTNYGNIKGKQDTGGVVGRTNAGAGIVSSDIWLKGCANYGTVSSVNDETIVATGAVGSTGRTFGLLVGNLNSGSIVIDHTLVKVDYVAPTCAAPGNKEYYKCNDADCNKLFLDEYALFETTLEDVTLPIDSNAHVASTDSTTIDPTYATAGSVSGQCSLCGATLSSTEIPEQRLDPTQGSESAPYIIASQTDFDAFVNDSKDGNIFEGKYFELRCDVNANEPVAGEFSGSFTGKKSATENHKVTLNISSEAQTGLFYSLGSLANISCLDLAGSVTSTTKYVGALAGTSKGNVSYINNSASVSGLSSVGGIVGYTSAAASIVSYCTNNGTLTATETSDAHIGGIVGYAKGSIDNSTNLVDISSSGSRVAGIVGYLGGDNINITNCTNDGDITALNSTGGIVGASLKDYTTINIAGCVNNGDVSANGKYTGGIIAYASKGAAFTNCTNNGNITNIKVATSDTGTAGIAGYLATAASTASTLLDGCTNNGVISSQSVATGGIVGMCGSYHSLNNCINTASVTSSQANGAGGLIGASYTGNVLTNCKNIDTNYIGNNTKSTDTSGCSVIDA